MYNSVFLGVCAAIGLVNFLVSAAPTVSSTGLTTLPPNFADLPKIKFAPASKISSTVDSRFDKSSLPARVTCNFPHTYKSPIKTPDYYTPDDLYSEILTCAPPQLKCDEKLRLCGCTGVLIQGHSFHLTIVTSYTENVTRSGPGGRDWTYHKIFKYWATLTETAEEGQVVACEGR